MNCPNCTGIGKVGITVTTFGSKEPPEKVLIPCHSCDGSGQMTDSQIKQFEKQKAFERNAWCKCGNKSGDVKYHPHGNKYCSKHCYSCKDCGKLVQIG